jgi:hypothetical protein
MVNFAACDTCSVTNMQRAVLLALLLAGEFLSLVSARNKDTADRFNYDETF